jgi:DNA-binding MarR family transcriptional regulator
MLPDPEPVYTGEEALLARLEQALFKAAKTLAFRGSRDVAGGRVDRSGYFAMVRLEQAGALRLSDLAEMLELDPSTVSRQIRGLEDLGLVARESDPSDRRASLLTLSALGRTELDEARRRRWAMFSAALADLPGPERDELARLLEHLADNLADPDTRRQLPLTREATR